MPSLLAAADAHQDRLLARADRAADAAEAVVRSVWLELLRVIEAGGPWHRVFPAARRVLAGLPGAAHAVTEDLAAAARDSARWTAEELVRRLTPSQKAEVIRRKKPLREAREAREADPAGGLLVGLILPNLTDDQVRGVLFAHGWTDRLRALTSLAAPDTLASQIATLVTQGKTTAEVARAIRPAVQGVQTAARRVARTAGLWVAHEAELATYNGLGDLVEGYQVHAVLDHATRPEHRRRDGTKYYKVPKAGQRSTAEMPHPPREPDGSWAWNCRCWLSPILAGG